MADGFVLVDKPAGWTSHDVVARCRRIFALRRIGHAGTLDPMATGLLVMALGRSTRLLRYIQESVKQYEAVAMFGVATDSLDADGAILSREEMTVDEDELRRVAQRFVGIIPQVPPMVSAIKVGGARLYELARAGVEVERAARNIEIQSLDIDEVAPGMYPEVTFRVTCGSGTYVRVLADDMAKALGGRAHLTALRRVAIGPHRVESAWTVDALTAFGEQGTLDAAVIAPNIGLRHLPEITVEEGVAAVVRNGAPCAEGPLSAINGTHRVLDPAGVLLAIYTGDGRRATAEVGMG